MAKSRGDILAIDRIKNGGPKSEQSIVEIGLLDFNAEPRSFVEQAKSITEIPRRHEAVVSYFRTHSATDLEVWASKLDTIDNELYPAAVGGVIGNWIETDSEAASEWVQKLPKGTRRDVAIGEFATRMKRIDKRAALEAVSWIDNAELREKLSRSVR